MSDPKPKKKSATFAQVLDYVDGPQAVLLDRTLDAKVVGVAIANPNMEYPFFGAEISRDQWERYKRGFVDFHFLFMYPKYNIWYIFDLMSKKNDKVTLIEVAKNAYEEDNYVPEPGFFSYDHSEPIKELTGGQATQMYKTDGIWDLPDFSQFYRKLTDLYVFFLAQKKYQATDTRFDLKKRIHDAFAGLPFRGGSSYVSLYASLNSVQELRDKLAIEKLRYSSQGEIDVRGQFDVFDEIAVALGEFKGVYKSLKPEYDSFQDYLSTAKLATLDVQEFEKKGAHADYIYNRTLALASALKMNNIDLIYSLTDKNPLAFAKITLSYYRRLERYFMFFAEGRIKDPRTINAVETEQHT